MMSWQDELSNLGKMAADVPLSSRTTLGIGGAATWLFRPSNEANMQQAMRLIPQTLHTFPLGRGSNLLIADSGIDGLVLDLSDVHMCRDDGLELVVGAGMRMGKLAQKAATLGLSGLEFMATVPGDVGGGIAMNAGAFGQQVSDVLHSVEVLQRNGKSQSIQGEDLNMAYRFTALPAGALITQARFSLQQGDTESIRQNMREMRQKRSASQPLASPNCGSVFKNPAGDFAARLIESVGLKGASEGNASISDVHANFIINEGGASCEDVLTLMRLAKDKVEQKFAVELEHEVRLVGCVL
ncbi:MAG: UDP-N-acetylmuramate dehydrogenase [Mariprofundaceae bacterium]|nr:UDP-N-acetylmuramate dehydrogenase [Mariprofundaceae bacterium]